MVDLMIKNQTWLLVTVFFGSLCRSTIVTYAAIWAVDELSVTDTRLGVTFGTAGALATVAGPVAGLCADRVGGKPVMVAGWFLQPFVFIGLIFYPYLPKIYSLGLIVLSTVLASVCSISSQAVVRETTKNTAYMEGFSRLRLFQNAGYLVGPPLGSLAVLSGWSDMFLTISVSSILALFTSIKVKNTNKDNKLIVNTKMKSIFNLNFFIFYAAGIFSMVSYSAFTTVLPAAMVSDMNFGPGHWTVLATINSILVVSLQVPFGKRFKRRDPVSILVFSAPLLGLPYASLVFGSSFFLILAVVISNAFGEIGWGPASQTQAIIMSPSRREGLCLGVFSSTLPIGLSLGPFIGFILKDNYGVSSAWILFAACGIFSSCLLLLIRPNAIKKQRAL